jgi:hypothetical protein
MPDLAVALWLAQQLLSPWPGSVSKAPRPWAIIPRRMGLLFARTPACEYRGPLRSGKVLQPFHPILLF